MAQSEVGNVTLSSLTDDDRAQIKNLVDGQYLPDDPSGGNTSSDSSSGSASSSDASSDSDSDDPDKPIPWTQHDGGQYPYLVRGAYLHCTFGSHTRKLNLPRSHGDYIGEDPKMNAGDCVPGQVDTSNLKEGSFIGSVENAVGGLFGGLFGKKEDTPKAPQKMEVTGTNYNIAPFGVCQAPGGPKGPTILLQSEKTDPVTGGPYVDQNNNPIQMEDNVKGPPCMPIIVGLWQNPHQESLLGLDSETPYEAITTGSFLVCKYCGIIEPRTSGQPELDHQADIGAAAPAVEVAATGGSGAAAGVAAGGAASAMAGAMVGGAASAVGAAAGGAGVAMAGAMAGGAAPAIAGAVGAAAAKIENQGPDTYGPGASSQSSSGNPSAEPSGIDSADEQTQMQYIGDYMINNWGLTTAQAAGIMGNLQQEGDFSPTNAQNSMGYPGRDNPDYISKYNINDGVGWGIAQWTYYTRKQGLLDYANKTGGSVGDMNTQMGYLYQELTTNYSDMWDQIKSSTSVSAVTVLWMKDFEDPEDQSSAAQQTRITNANAIYNELAGESSQ